MHPGSAAHVFPGRFFANLTQRPGSDASNQAPRPQPKITKPEDESPPVTPDSTCEPPPRPACPFQEGDEVFYRNESGQNVFGTIGEVRVNSLLINFADGAQKWASTKRVRKLAPLNYSGDSDDAFEQPKPKHEKTKGRERQRETNKSSSSSAISKPVVQQAKTSQKTELPCASCGVSKRISTAKAKQFEDGSNGLFKCNRCTNQINSQFRNSGLGLGEDASIHVGPFFKPGPSKNALPSRNGNVSTSEVHSFFQRSRMDGQGTSSSGFAFKTVSGAAGVAKKSSFVTFPGLPPRTSSFNKSLQSAGHQPQSHIENCFSCEKPTKWQNSVRCNMCQRPIHHLCMNLTPPPLKGDKFWHVVCKYCSSRNGEIVPGGASMFKRRNITGWADIAQLLISCLMIAESGQIYFDLCSEICPYFEINMNRLHIPVKFKVLPAAERKNFLEFALKNTKLKFMNGKDAAIQRSETEWAILPDVWRCHMAMSIMNECESRSPAVDKKFSRRASSTDLQVQSPKMKNTKTNSTGLPSQVDSQGERRKIVAKRACEPIRPRQVVSESPNKKIDSKGKGSKIDIDIEGNVSTRLSKIDLKRVESSSSISSNSSTSSTSSSTSVEAETLPATPPRGRGRPKGSLMKRPLSPASSPEKKEVRRCESAPLVDSNSDSSHPSFKKSKIGSQSPSTKVKLAKSCTPPPVLPSVRSTLSPVRPVQKVASPPKLLPLVEAEDESSSESEVSSDDDKGASDQEEISAPTARKSADTDPRAGRSQYLRVPEVQVLLDEQSATSVLGKRVGRKSEVGSKKPADKRNGSEEPVPAPPRTRGRKSGSGLKNANKTKVPLAKPKTGQATTAKSTTLGLSATAKRGNIVGGSGAGAERSARAQENRPPPPSGRSAADELLFDAAFYGGYRISCLPPAPTTAEAIRLQYAQVASFYRAEIENEKAARFLLRNDAETRCESRRKSELFRREKRELRDHETYEVSSVRRNAKGELFYNIQWKNLDDSESESSEEETEVSRVGDNKFISINVPPPPEPNLPQEEPEYLMEVDRKTVKNSGMDYLDYIDLTDSP